MPPDRGLADKQLSGVKGKKNRLTYLFVTNANGSEKLAPLIIGKAQKPHAFKNKSAAQLGFHYQNNTKAWMTSSIYKEWLLEWDQRLRNSDQKILLFQDNFSGHIVPNSLTQIRVVNFEPNLTAHVQPLDQGIIHCFKANYRAQFFDRAIDLYETGTTPSKIYDIDQLEAMRLANGAWHAVDSTTIRNCWRKAGILPDVIPNPNMSSIPNPSLPISALIHHTAAATAQLLEDSEDSGSESVSLESSVEKLVDKALDGLEATGVLQRLNRMDINEILNPATETHNIFEATDDDIFQTVMDAKAAREAEESGGGKGLGNAIGQSIPKPDEEPIPTRREALEAAIQLKKYVNTLEEPFARTLEAILGTFGRRTRLLDVQGMKDNKLTDYFPRK
jgi:hypothetical protein